MLKDSVASHIQCVFPINLYTKVKLIRYRIEDSIKCVRGGLLSVAFAFVSKMHYICSITEIK